MSWFRKKENYKENENVSIKDDYKMNNSKVSEDLGNSDVYAVNYAIKYLEKQIEKFMVQENMVKKHVDNINDTYYFRGNPINNYFKLDDYLFRIISLNSDNSIKLAAVNNTFDTIYNEYANKEEMVIFNTSSAFNELDKWYEETLSKYNDYFVDGT